jgi:uncharacterized protein (DUF2141 family)
LQFILSICQFGSDFFKTELTLSSFTENLIEEQMKTTIIKILLGAIVTFQSQSLFGQSSLEITITNIREVKGSIRASVFNEKSNFLKKEYQGRVTKVVGETMIISFENLPTGEYALSVIHDENENGELDSNFMGIPKEGFGFGNNALGRFGPPDFEETVVKVANTAQKQSIALKYY